MDDFRNRVRPPVQALENLIKIGAFESVSPGRRGILHGIFTADLNANSKAGSRSRLVPLDLNLKDRVIAELKILGMSFSAHPIALTRRKLNYARVSSAAKLESQPDGAEVRVAGIVAHRNSVHTKTGKHVLFLTIEDETGIADLIAFSDILSKSRQACFRSPAVIATGRIRKHDKPAFRSSSPASSRLTHFPLFFRLKEPNQPILCKEDLSETLLDFDIKCYHINDN